jgi:hypothetical protein
MKAYIVIIAMLLAMSEAVASNGERESVGIPISVTWASANGKPTNLQSDKTKFASGRARTW